VATSTAVPGVPRERIRKDIIDHIKKNAKELIP
jgi:hypothetical protein